MSENKLKWTSQQRQAIEELDSDVLVTASAGTGKTAVLSGRCVEIIANKKICPDVRGLLVLTFTEAAAEEMRSRIAGRLEEAFRENGERHRWDPCRQYEGRSPRSQSPFSLSGERVTDAAMPRESGIDKADMVQGKGRLGNNGGTGTGTESLLHPPDRPLQSPGVSLQDLEAPDRRVNGKEDFGRDDAQDIGAGTAVERH